MKKIFKKINNRENKELELYVYKKPNQMDGYKRIGIENKTWDIELHNYTDDVALCYAHDLEEASSIFSQLYDRDSIKDCVEKAWFNNYGICICTDY